MLRPLLAVLMLGSATLAVGQRAAPSALVDATKATTRTPANVARDRYRHPVETLAFFGVKPTDTVVEIWPSGGWYTEILAPYLAAHGSFYAAGPTAKALATVTAKQAAAPAAYRTMHLATFPAPAASTDAPAAVPAASAPPAVPAGSADVVLTFRNVHNWRFGKTDQTQAAFDQMFAMLKPGGTLGLVEHRLPETAVGIEEARSGYMKQSSVIGFATKAGFRLVGESKVNANPRDTHDYAKGVWTLPPSYIEGDADRARYTAIGESDRMTLKFVKPA
ncbi:methyltransferase type 11 [Sphingomonas oligophenolica]|uniref:Methyltransferase type 11 n=1 Tax=Sphingomonas oligophenolica TaxID=301154 RepID=A0A502CCC0_9SPHN|nr:class I SAM-dependent methyltransferase [Sphingomonas oligophenolica]TPG09669.1 methyltransferase type 11 [Sphingomonas oligophenolica]